MLALLIDTSSAAVTAAVAEIRPSAPSTPSIVAARTTIDARAHAELLAPSIRSCLEEIDASPRDLGAVIAGVGPGPFTGLRVGLVTAVAMADALGIAAFGVCSLDAIAAVSAHDETLLVAGDARRREVYWARYGNGVRVVGPDVTAPSSVDIGRATAMAGAGARLYADVFGLPLLDIDYPTPLGLALLAVERITGGAPNEPLTPLYLRRPDAVAATSFKTVTP